MVKEAPIEYAKRLKNDGGGIEAIAGGMFSGKTEELIRRLRRATIAKQRIQVFKPKIDNRYDEEKVVSHMGQNFEADPVVNASEMLDKVKKDSSVVAIDGVQLMDSKVVDVVEKLADSGKRVIVAGLDMDFRGVPFGPMPDLMARAEVVDKLHAICVVCGGEASRTQRLINGQPANFNDPVVFVGATEVYEARCRADHEVPGRPEFDVKVR